MKRTKLFMPIITTATLAATLAPTLAACGMHKHHHQQQKHQIKITNIDNVDWLKIVASKLVVTSSELKNGFELELTLEDQRPYEQQQATIFTIESINIGSKMLVEGEDYTCVYSGDLLPFLGTQITINFSPIDDTNLANNDIQIKVRADNYTSIQITDSLEQAEVVAEWEAIFNPSSIAIGQSAPALFNIHWAPIPEPENNSLNDVTFKIDQIAVAYKTAESGESFMIDKLILDSDYSLEFTLDGQTCTVTIDSHGLAKLGEHYYDSTIELLYVKWSTVQ